jgi:hypothetical protein
MHEGVAPSEACRVEGNLLVDARQDAAAAAVLRQAIRKGKLGLFALLSSNTKPTRLVNKRLVGAAITPKNGTVLTFYRLEGCLGAPFGLSWKDLEELARDPLCVEKDEFFYWLKAEERKRAWPCHSLSNKPRKPRGRPSEKIDAVVAAIEKLSKSGKFQPTMSIKEVHSLIERVHPGLRISPETVARAMKIAS